MAHVLKDNMNHFAIEIKRGPKLVQCIVRLAGEVEYKTYPLTKSIVDPAYNSNDGTYQFDKRWEKIAYPDAATEDDRRVAGIKDLLHVVDSFLNGMLPVTSKARRWLEALRNYPMASEPLPDSIQPRNFDYPTEEGDVTMSTKKAKVKKEGGKARNGACAKVHEIATELGKTAARGDVIEACVKAGINKSTAGTQYQKWLHRKD